MQCNIQITCSVGKKEQKRGSKMRCVECCVEAAVMQNLFRSYCSGGMWCVMMEVCIQSPHRLRIEAMGQSGGSGCSSICS